MGSGFKLMSSDVVEQTFSITSNPFVALFIGLFATALMQSSSTTTAIIVTLVAAETLSLKGAVPMIMGANIGTSVTSTIVAMGHIRNKDEFQHAISAATVHDFFNIIVVLILLPIELYTGSLSRIATSLVGLLPVYSSSSSSFSLIGATIKPLSAMLVSLFDENAFIVLGLALGLLIVSLRNLSQLLQNLLIGKSQEIVDKYVFGHPLKSLFWGVVITAGVQSSSVTASLTVPLVAAKRATLEKVFPFLIGANVGTTVTALIAAITQSQTAMAIAMVHVLFNFFGVLILFPIPQIRRIPILIAEQLGTLSAKHRAVGICYVLVLFFLIPFAIIFS